MMLNSEMSVALCETKPQPKTYPNEIYKVQEKKNLSGFLAMAAAVAKVVVMGIPCFNACSHGDKATATHSEATRQGSEKLFSISVYGSKKTVKKNNLQKINKFENPCLPYCQRTGKEAKNWFYNKNGTKSYKLLSLYKWLLTEFLTLFGQDLWRIILNFSVESLLLYFCCKF